MPMVKDSCHWTSLITDICTLHHLRCCYLLYMNIYYIWVATKDTFKMIHDTLLLSKYKNINKEKLNIKMRNNLQYADFTNRPPVVLHMFGIQGLIIRLDHWLYSLICHSWTLLKGNPIIKVHLNSQTSKISIHTYSTLKYFSHVLTNHILLNLRVKEAKK